MASLINLSDRKKRILKFIIKEYIDTAEPVGSRTISKNKDLGVSAATIRKDAFFTSVLSFFLPILLSLT